MITEAMWARTSDVIADSLAAAVAQGWGAEARARLAPVQAAVTVGNRDEARAVIADQLAIVAADRCAARGLYIERLLQKVDAELTTAAEREAQERFEAAMLADMRAFLGGREVPATFTAPAPEPVAALF